MQKIVIKPTTLAEPVGHFDRAGAGGNLKVRR